MWPCPSPASKPGSRPAAVDFVEVVRGRRMCRSFRADPVAPEQIDALLRLAQRAPAAGNTQGWQFLVLEGAEQVGRYWEATLAPERRDRFPWPGLLRAPVLIVPCADAGAYVSRYGEADKAARVAASAAEKVALAASSASWSVPYWLVDTAMATMTLLLGAVDAGLGACLFGQFEHEAAVRAAFGLPDEVQPIGTIAVGWPDGADRSSRSARGRPRPPLADVVHRGHW